MTFTMPAVLRPFSLPVTGLFFVCFLSACEVLWWGIPALIIDVSIDRRTPGRYLDDNLLETKLRSAYKSDERIGAGVHISVTAINGIVLLSGETGTDAQRRRAGEMAEAQQETRKVVNELQLSGATNPASRLNDAWITGKVKARMLNLRNFPASAIKVVTEHGKVYLLGLVTREEGGIAIAAIRRVRGITHIVAVFEYTD
ncbi:MAG: BON domain-containing protein [Gammaproteobacteria bacterium]